MMTITSELKKHNVLVAITVTNWITWPFTTAPWWMLQNVKDKMKIIMVLSSTISAILTFYLIWQCWALPIQQQIKIWCQKYGPMGIQLPDWVENIVGKGEITHNEQFLLFHNVFKSCLLLMHQNEYLWNKGLNVINLSKEKTKGP